MGARAVRKTCFPLWCWRVWCRSPILAERFFWLLSRSIATERGAKRGGMCALSFAPRRRRVRPCAPATCAPHGDRPGRPGPPPSPGARWAPTARGGSPAGAPRRARAGAPLPQRCPRQDRQGARPAAGAGAPGARATPGPPAQSAYRTCKSTRARRRAPPWRGAARGPRRRGGPRGLQTPPRGCQRGTARAGAPRAHGAWPLPRAAGAPPPPHAGGERRADAALPDPLLEEATPERRARRAAHGALGPEGGARGPPRAAGRAPRRVVYG